MIVSKRFAFGSFVEVCGEGIEKLPQFQSLIGKKLIVDSVRYYQSRHFRADGYTDAYFVFPAEFEGTEHDEGEWIGGCNLRYMQ